ncbi:hypothetical protein D9M68_881930 [compost metagenome]
MLPERIELGPMVVGHAQGRALVVVEFRERHARHIAQVVFLVVLVAVRFHPPVVGDPRTAAGLAGGAADEGCLLEHDDRCAIVERADGAGQCRPARTSDHDVKFLVPFLRLGADNGGGAERGRCRAETGCLHEAAA